MEQLQYSTTVLEFCAYDENTEVMDTAQMLLSYIEKPNISS